MANKVIPFPPEKPAPILTRRWRTIVDVHGTLYSLDVTASYSLLQSAPTPVEPAETSAGSGCGARGGTAATPVIRNNPVQISLISSGTVRERFGNVRFLIGLSRIQYFAEDAGSPRLTVSDLPGPEQPKAFPVPADNGRTSPIPPAPMGSRIS